MADAAPTPESNKKNAGIGCLALLLMFGACALIGTCGDDEPVGSSDQSDAPTSSPAVSTAEQRAAFMAFYRDVLTATSVSDRAGRELTESIPTGDPVSIYRAAKSAESGSREARYALDDLDIPGVLPDSLRLLLEEGKQHLSDAFVFRESSARDLARGVDEGRISALADAQESGESYQAKVLLGMANLVGVGFVLDSTFADSLQALSP